MDFLFGQKPGDSSKPEETLLTRPVAALSVDVNSDFMISFSSWLLPDPLPFLEEFPEGASSGIPGDSAEVLRVLARCGIWHSHGTAPSVQSKLSEHDTGVFHMVLVYRCRSGSQAPAP